MPIELSDLVKFNCEVETKEEDAESPSPVLLLNKYRVRLVDVKKLPILNNFASFQSLGFPSDNVILIDSPISENKEIVEKIIKQSDSEINIVTASSENDEIMDTDEDKENGPLQTSFLTLEKLKKGANGGGENEEIVGFSFENQNFDCNPVTVPDSITVQNILQSTNNLFGDEVSRMTKWVSTTSSSLPLIAWHSSGRTSKNVMYTGITRILGYYNENSEKEVKYLNHAFDRRNYTHFNRCRAVYDVIRRYKTENRQDPGEIVVDMRWNTSKDTELLSQSMNSTECTIKIDLGWADSRFYTDGSLFNQLFLVLNLADVLTNPGNEVNFAAHWQTFDDLVIEMNELIEKCAEDENNFAVKNE